VVVGGTVVVEVVVTVVPVAAGALRAGEDDEGLAVECDAVQPATITAAARRSLERVRFTTRRISRRAFQ
jgi:hypothetical protein